jgi:predicted DNA-binding transcriptional regulator AlpA
MRAIARPEVTGRASNGGRYLPARAVWERYGVTSMTIYRWLADDAMNFPQPIYFGRFRYWYEPELDEWGALPAARGEARASEAEKGAA